MYKYYQEFCSEEHMLFSKEIAILYNIKNKKDNPDYIKVSNIIKQYLIANKIKYKQLYYETKHGLSKVYPKKIYEPAIIEYLERNNNKCTLTQT